MKKEYKLLLTEEQFKKVSEIIKEDNRSRFIPEEGETYYSILSDGSCYKDTNNLDFKDLERIKRGNSYRTEEEAKLADDKQLAIVRVIDWIDENLGHFEPDWSNSDERKFIPCYDYFFMKIDSSLYGTLKPYSPIGYLRSEEDFKKLLKACKDDLELIFK